MAALAKSSGLKEELARTSQLLMDGALSRYVVIPSSSHPASRHRCALHFPYVSSVQETLAFR